MSTNKPLFEVIGAGSYDPETDSLDISPVSNACFGCDGTAETGKLLCATCGAKLDAERSLAGTYRAAGTTNRLEVEHAGRDSFVWHITTLRGRALLAGQIDGAGLAQMLEQGWAK